jgi:hypothetical protein
MSHRFLNNNSADLQGSPHPEVPADWAPVDSAHAAGIVHYARILLLSDPRYFWEVSPLVLSCLVYPSVVLNPSQLITFELSFCQAYWILVSESYSIVSSSFSSPRNPLNLSVQLAVDY